MDGTNRGVPLHGGLPEGAYRERGQAGSGLIRIQGITEDRVAEESREAGRLEAES